MLSNQLVEKSTGDYLRKIVDSQTDSYFEFTYSKESVLSIDFYSDNLLQLLDLKIADTLNLQNQFLKNRLHPLDSDAFMDAIITAKTSLSSCTHEFRIITSNHTIKWIKSTVKTKIKSNGKRVFFGKLVDCTLEKNKFEKINDIAIQNQTAIELLNKGVWNLNLQSNFIWHSTESLRILEVESSTSQLINSPEKWDERIHPNDRENYYRVIQEHFENKTSFYELFYRVFCGNRYKMILEKGKVIERDSNQKPIRIVGIHSEIDLQNEKQGEMLKTLLSVNMDNYKLANFSEIITSKLQNQIINLSSLVKLKEEGEFDSDEVFSYIKSIANELTNTSDNLVNLINDIKIEETNEKELNLFHSLEKIVTVVSDEITSRNVSIINHIPKDLVISHSPAFLHNILLNLTSNAIKYSKHNENTCIEYFVENQDNFTVLNVKDNGLGIDLKKYKDEVFGLYKTFHPVRNSNGIGLYLAKKQVENMGGKIELDSEVNVGSTFKVYFKKK